MHEAKENCIGADIPPMNEKNTKFWCHEDTRNTFGVIMLIEILFKQRKRKLMQNVKSLEDQINIQILSNSNFFHYIYVFLSNGCSNTSVFKVSYNFSANWLDNFLVLNQELLEVKENCTEDLSPHGFSNTSPITEICR